MEENRKYGGVIIEERGTDYVAGGATKIAYEVVNQSGDWRKWKSKSEKQKRKIDNSSCVTYSGENVVEPQLNKMAAEGQFTDDAVKFFQDNGYLIDGQFDTSERFNAVMSGTTDKGNSAQRVWDGVQDYGLLPDADCPFTDIMTSAQYFRNDFTQAQKEKAKRILEYITIQYEWVIQNSVTGLVDWEKKKIAEALKQAPLQLITPVCNWGANPTPDGNIECQHATALYAIDDNGYYIEDTYIPFDKMLSSDYVIRYALKGVVTINPKYKKSMTTAKLLKNTKNENELSINLALDDPATMANLLPKFGINVPKLADGSIDWANVKIDGTYTIN